jgi:hypothetical protein
MFNVVRQYQIMNWLISMDLSRRFIAIRRISYFSCLSTFDTSCTCPNKWWDGRLVSNYNGTTTRRPYVDVACPLDRVSQLALPSPLEMAGLVHRYVRYYKTSSSLKMMSLSAVGTMTTFPAALLPECWRAAPKESPRQAAALHRPLWSSRIRRNSLRLEFPDRS